MAKNFYGIRVLWGLIFCSSFHMIAYHTLDGLSGAIGVFDMSQAFANMAFNEERRESRILAIRDLRLEQGYGDPVYKKFYDLSIVRFYGALSFNYSFHSRQDIEAANIGVFLFPAMYLADVECRDINAHAKTLIRSSFSRFGFFFNPYTGMTEKDIYGLIEFDFSGLSVDTEYVGKLRHAFGEIVWNSGAFLFGQYFHPLFIKECFPRTVQDNQGTPFETMDFVPQARISQRVGSFEFVIGLSGQSYILNFGPFNGEIVQSHRFIEDAIVPDFNFQVKWIFDNSFYGGVIDFKRLVPRLMSNNNVKVNEHIDSVIGEIFFHNAFWWGELNLKAIYAQNGNDHLLISGFAVKAVDPVTDFRTYANTAAVSAWLDVFCMFHNQEVLVGLFAGGALNLGANSPLFIDPTTNQPIVYALNGISQNILYTARVSPRIAFARDAFRFGFECSWNGIAYGCLNNFARVINPKTVNDFFYTVTLDYVF